MNTCRVLGQKGSDTASALLSVSSLCSKLPLSSVSRCLPHSLSLICVCFQLTNQYLLTAMTTGLCVRSAIIGTIFRKALRLSGRARVEHSVGQITTMISTDSARLDRSSAFFHK
jgi:hypothetical protein